MMFRFIDEDFIAGVVRGSLPLMVFGGIVLFVYIRLQAPRKKYKNKKSK